MKDSYNISKFNGIVPMIYCFFNKNGSIDKVLMQEQIQTIRQMKVRAIAALGLGTEVNKLSFNEKKLIIDLVTKEKKDLSFAVTIQGKTVEEYKKLIEISKINDVNWIILQPLINKKTTDFKCFNFFKKILPFCDGTLVGIQNAKEYLGVGVDRKQIKKLYKDFDNFRAIKAEAPAIDMKKEINSYPKDLHIFNGRGGQEIIENLFAGCSGIVPTPECTIALKKIYKHVRNKKISLALKEYQKILPTIIFIMQSIETLTFYGKRIFAKKIGINNLYDRKTNLELDYFGKQLVKRFADQIDII